MSTETGMGSSGTADLKACHTGGKAERRDVVETAIHLAKKGGSEVWASGVRDVVNGNKESAPSRRSVGHG